MLTQQDLHAIGDLIDQKLEIKLEEKLETKLEEKLETKLEEKLEAKFEEKLSPIRRDLTFLKKETKKLHRENREILDFLDRRLINHEKRLDRVENNLDLSHVI